MVKDGQGSLQLAVELLLPVFKDCDTGLHLHLRGLSANARETSVVSLRLVLPRHGSILSLLTLEALLLLNQQCGCVTLYSLVEV